MNSKQPSIFQCFVAELIGTFILIFFGCGAVNAAVAYGAQAGVWQVAIVWGVAVMLAIYATGSLSGAHINPAITLTMLVWDGFEIRKVAPYMAAQVCGAFLAAALLFMIFSPSLAAVEKAKGVVRGQPGSEMTASCFGEFYPNPGGFASGDEPYSPEKHAELRERVPHGIAFLAEVVATAMLAFMVFACTDQRNLSGPGSQLAPVFIGLTVSLLISVIGPMTQACLNPARDFGPRLLAAFAGWGSIALPLGSDWGWLTVYIIAPCVGAVIGGGLYKKVVLPMLEVVSTDTSS